MQTLSCQDQWLQHVFEGVTLFTFFIRCFLAEWMIHLGMLRSEAMMPKLKVNNYLYGLLDGWCTVERWDEPRISHFKVLERDLILCWTIMERWFVGTMTTSRILKKLDALILLKEYCMIIIFIMFFHENKTQNFESTNETYPLSQENFSHCTANISEIHVSFITYRTEFIITFVVQNSKFIASNKSYCQHPGKNIPPQKMMRTFEYK